MTGIQMILQTLFLSANHFFMLILLICPVGCGAVGPPIPPEEVGIEAKIREQRLEQSGKKEGPTEDPSMSPMEEPSESPDFYPLTPQ